MMRGMTAAAPATPTVPHPPRAFWIMSFYRSAIGKKAVMAVTGVFLFGWILLHMLGNLKVYTGPAHYNAYAEFLITMGSPLLPNKAALVVVRTLLFIAVCLHILAATQLTIMNRNARPIGYTERDYVSATYAARTMRWGGVIILLFVIYHLLHLTFGTLHPDFDPGLPGHAANVYHNFVTGFQVWWVSAFYIIANLALGMHLYHGLWSMFNSLGLSHDKFNPWKRSFATGFALIVTVGNISFPIAVLMGVLR
jgi:succinate dehydrogenase / fumarate reductase, cytochrome b subunit